MCSCVLCTNSLLIMCSCVLCTNSLLIMCSCVLCANSLLIMCSCFSYHVMLLSTNSLLIMCSCVRNVIVLSLALNLAIYPHEIGFTKNDIFILFVIETVHKDREEKTIFDHLIYKYKRVLISWISNVWKKCTAGTLWARKPHSRTNSTTLSTASDTTMHRSWMGWAFISFHQHAHLNWFLFIFYFKTSSTNMHRFHSELS